jgi:ribosomal protein S2
VFDITEYYRIGQNVIDGNIMTKIANRCSEYAAQFRYLGTAITNQNLIQEEIIR